MAATALLILELLAYFEVRSSQELGWAHAVNDLEGLKRAIGNKSVHMIEADISIHDGQAVMQHDPTQAAGPSFETWLQVFDEQTHPSTTSAAAEAQAAIKKGIKLDFKKLEAVEPCLVSLQAWAARRQPAACTVWLNADILAGPGHAPARVDAAAFLELCRPTGFPLSLGWSVALPAPDGYTPEMTAAMWEVCRLLHGHVTFPIYAPLLLIPSSAALNELVARRSSHFSLTLWGRVTAHHYAQLSALLDPHFHFFDMQDLEGNQLYPQII